MNLTISGKHVDVGEALRSHADAALKSTVGRHFEGAVHGDAALSRDGHGFRADISLHVGRNILVHGHASAADAYVAFDGACERVGKRLHRYKQRLRDHHARPGRHDEGILARQTVFAAESEEAFAEEPVGKDPTVIAEMKTPIDTLTVAEAVMRLDLAGQPALMFRNAANGLFNVVYRRSDGHVGWIDPANAAST